MFAGLAALTALVASAWTSEPGAPLSDPTEGATAPYGALWLLRAFALATGAALLSVVETALWIYRRPDGSSARREGHPGPGLFHRFARKRSDALLSVQAGKHVCLGAAALAAAGTPGVQSMGLPAWLAALVVMWIVLLIMTEAVPGALTASVSERIARGIAPALWILHGLAWPIRLLARASRSGSGVNGEDENDTLAQEESLKNLLRSGLANASLGEEEQEMIDGVFELRESTAAEIMTPRSDVEAYPATLTQDEMLATLRANAHSRVPIYRESRDQIIGVLHAKEALLFPGKDYRELLRPPVMVSVDKRLSELLRDFRRNRTHLAVALDEFGVTAGVVTLHDILEEIVGDMVGPADEPEQAWRHLGGGRVRMSGAQDLDVIEERLGISFPKDVARTIGGFIMNSLGQIPSVGATVRHDGFEFEALRIAQRRIELVEARPAREPEAGPENAPREAAP